MTRRDLVIAALISVAAFGALTPTAEARFAPRVVGGDVAGPEEAPWAAALVSGEGAALASQLCGATVIAPRAVVTAAHCLEDTYDSFDVVIGRKRLSSTEGERIPVAAIRVNPSFYTYAPRNDVAVLLLSRPTSAPALPLAAGTDGALTADGATVRVYGWGTIKSGGFTSSDDLRVGAMQTLSDVECRRRWPGVSSKSGQLCATGPFGGLPAACSGDSGGPLVGGEGLGARLVGLPSYGGDRCGDPEEPLVFTLVASFAPWIARQAGIAPPPGPTRAPGLSKVALKLSGFSCPSTCSVVVRASGEGAESLSAVDVQVRAEGTDRVFSARRLGERKWKAKLGQLPGGRIRVIAAGLDGGGRAAGKRAEVTLAAVD